MNLRRKNKEGAEVFTDSLNDIMFFLLLFFIIISTLVNPNVIKLDPPSSEQTSTASKGEVTLAVDAQHNFYVNNLPVPFDMLEPVILAETNAKETKSVILFMDKSLTVQDVADVMQIGSKLEIKFALSVNPSK
ncbi:MAG TPA: biopolymer transporter ExbD [Bacteroidia bacterium]|nr:biopolymer transporter ExbD [Bacteroidia bacterium]